MADTTVGKIKFSRSESWGRTASSDLKSPSVLVAEGKLQERERFKQKVLELRRGCLPISDAGAIAACDELLRWLEAGA